MEQFGYNIWIRQRQIYKYRPSLLTGSKLMPTSIVSSCEQNRWKLSDFGRLKQATLMRCCFSGFSDREVQM